MKLPLSRPRPAFRSLPVCARLAGAVLCTLPLQACLEDESSFGFGSPKATILPPNPLPTDDLVGGATVEHPPGEVATLSFQWNVNGADSGLGDTKTVPASQTFKGDVWQVLTTANYASGRSDGPGSASVTIGNTRPTATANITTDPDPACKDTVIEFTVNIMLDDADGDPVTARIQWEVDPDGNQGPLPTEIQVGETGMTFTGGPFGERAAIRAAVTPNDGDTDGTTIRAPKGIPPAGRQGCPADPPLGPGSGSEGPSETSSALRENPSRTAATTTLSSSSIAPSLSVGTYEVCSIGLDGGLDCLGAEGSALTQPPEGHFSQVAVAVDYACALETLAREIRCWGEVPGDSSLRTPPSGPFQKLAVGTAAACALGDSGELRCWGAEDSALLEAPEGRFTQLEISGSYGCAIDAETDATVCWGD